MEKFLCTNTIHTHRMYMYIEIYTHLHVYTYCGKKSQDLIFFAFLTIRIKNCRYHTCALFSSSSRIICWGCTTSQYGQLGRPWGTNHFVGNGCANCVPVNAVDYVSFSNNAVPILQVAAGHFHTCGKNTLERRERIKRKVEIFCVKVEK